jgi:hypothetical protein
VIDYREGEGISVSASAEHPAEKVAAASSPGMSQCADADVDPADMHAAQPADKYYSSLIQPVQDAKVRCRHAYTCIYKHVYSHTPITLHALYMDIFFIVSNVTPCIPL